MESLGNGICKKKKSEGATVSSQCRHTRPHPPLRGRKGASSRTIKRRLFSSSPLPMRAHTRTYHHIPPSRERASAPSACGFARAVPAPRAACRGSGRSGWLSQPVSRPVSHPPAQTAPRREEAKEKERRRRRAGLLWAVGAAAAAEAEQRWSCLQWASGSSRPNPSSSGGSER